MSSYGRQTQSKAQTESNAKILRALVKQPDNKVCADCKRNDPRWASWNIGCFLCIRCSGIHRSMGTHISRVKSIDLDIWTPEQMAAIQNWGNRRSNAYWEAHLKAGHVPPDHKVESFIRSKYELKRWAKEGPVPSDPAELDEGSAVAPTAAAPTSPAAQSGSTSKSTGKSANSALDLLGGGESTTAASTTSVSKPSNNLLDDFAPPTNAPAKNVAKQPPAVTTTSTAKPATGGGGGLFDLDWHDGPAAASNPSSTTSPVLSPGGAAKGKNDILSLFASSKPISPVQNTQNTGSNGGLGGLDSSFGGLSVTGNTQANPVASSTGSSNPWGSGSQTTNTTNNNLFGSSDPWASSTTTTGGTSDLWGNPTSSTTTNSTTTSKNDAFADIWSDFK